MKRKYTASLLICLLAFLPLRMTAADFYGYTNENPLIIVCDWDFRPFEFQGSDGQPKGYNVEVLDLLFNKLSIPHRFVMQEWTAATRMFERHEADLIHGSAHAYKMRPYVMTHKYVNYYRVKVAHHVSRPPLLRLADMKPGSVLAMKKNDYAALVIEQMDSVPFSVQYHSPKEGLTGVRLGRYPYYIWGEIPLQNKLRELRLDSIALDDVDIPAAELRVVGYDKEIIDLIDDEYTRLEQAGEFQKIYDKWFNPENVHDDASPVALLVLIGLVIAAVVGFVFNRLITVRVKAAVRRSDDLNRMMTHALKMGEYYVLEYDLQAGWVRNAYGDLLPEQGISDKELISRVAPEQREEFRQMVESMERGDINEWTITRRWNTGTDERPNWREYDGTAVLEREHGVPHYIFHTIKDVTSEVAEEKRNQALGTEYKKMFQTNMVAMSVYGADGKLIDLNDKMRDLCQFEGDREQFFRATTIFDDPFASALIEPGSHDVYHVCGHMYYPELGLDKYIESRLMPLYDDNDQLVFYIVTTRDVTAERDMYMRQRENDRRLQEANVAVENYERQLRYLLEESRMFVWRLDLSTRLISFSRTLREAEYTESVEEYLAGLTDADRAEAIRNQEEIVMQGKPFNVVHAFNYTPITSDPSWFSVGGMPVRNAEGRLTGYFGLVRDVTDLMQAQEKLRVETVRAEDSGRLKSAFLANMTHEIRTPLNAIVGFSDLLQVIDEPDERKEFIRIIRNNCDMLLRLINDILEASSMGQSLAIEPQHIDLSSVFNDICQTLAQRVQEPGVEFLKDNPYDTCPAFLDKGRLQQLLTNFVTNAVKYTHQGHIRVGYRLEMRNAKGDMVLTDNGQQGIYFYCEDTGAGIPKEKQAAVFERFVKLNDFVQGTGLGLSICKAIVDRCNGKIGVTSEGEGHGSTFWFWIPVKSKE